MTEGNAFVPAQRGVEAIHASIMIPPIDANHLVGLIFLIRSTIPGPVAMLRN